MRHAVNLLPFLAPGSQIKKGGPLSPLAALLYMGQRFPVTAFPSPGASGMHVRPSLPLTLRQPTGRKGHHPASQHDFRPSRFADIPTPLPTQGTVEEVSVTVSILFLLASLALDACAFPSALARQRFSIAPATVIADRPGLRVHYQPSARRRLRGASRSIVC